MHHNHYCGIYFKIIVTTCKTMDRPNCYISVTVFIQMGHLKIVVHTNYVKVTVRGYKKKSSSLRSMNRLYHQKLQNTCYFCDIVVKICFQNNT